MSKRDKKRQREEAIKAEILRREQQRAERSPIDRDQMLFLIEYVGKNVMEKGHEHNFEFTKQWASSNSINIDSLITFLENERIKDDWDLVVSADPYEYFGATSERLSWMPLEKNDLEALLDWLDVTLPERGCKHDYTLTKEWLSSKDVDISTTLMALMSKGGGCDCEVVYNVEPENIYP
jgi:hypothetical protein